MCCAQAIFPDSSLAAMRRWGQTFGGAQSYYNIHILILQSQLATLKYMMSGRKSINCAGLIRSNQTGGPGEDNYFREI